MAPARAVWKGRVLAESDDIITVEGKLYFPLDSLHRKFFEPSGHHSICLWKGRASYLTVVVGGERKENGAWYYPKPLLPARRVQNRVAFGEGIDIEVSRDRVA